MAKVQRLKLVLISFTLFVGGCSALMYIFSDPLPQSSKDQAAQERVETLIDHMWQALNAPAWFAAEGVEWTFRKHHYLWHKRLNRVRVDLSPSLSVYIETLTGRGRAFMRGEPLDTPDQPGYIAQAIMAFNNDSFWLAAPFKVRDPGTHRSLVSDAEGEGILVYYTSGGTTPGDRYLWRFNQQNQPIKSLCTYKKPGAPGPPLICLYVQPTAKSTPILCKSIGITPTL